jgi:hypothetical protein
MEGEAQQREGDVEQLSMASVYFSTKVEIPFEIRLITFFYIYFFFCN